ncbi:hypothetical protein M5D96_004168 [Drosophila gunungcola]|uniref:Uncharacterized protein n=1 Tax=Drosophila gunungcola TaxID=103775 RepID=A0A9Q0BT12_9MUSC|nr:hypothetical protein M5D96_004168 [Drosophila gunungcola]
MYIFKISTRQTRSKDNAILLFYQLLKMNGNSSSSGDSSSCPLLGVRAHAKKPKKISEWKRKETTFAIKRVLWQIPWRPTYTYIPGIIAVFSFLQLPIFCSFYAFRFQRIKWHEIKSYYEKFLCCICRKT